MGEQGAPHRIPITADYSDDEGPAKIGGGGAFLALNLSLDGAGDGLRGQRLGDILPGQDIIGRGGDIFTAGFIGKRGAYLVSDARQPVGFGRLFPGRVVGGAYRRCSG